MKKFQFIPFTYADGAPTMKNSVIAGLYNRCVESGIAEVIFDDGSINDAEDFMRHVKDFNTLFWTIYYKDEVIGFFYLNRLERTHAYCHFTAFPEIWGTGLAEEAGKEAMGLCLTLFDTIIGLIPADNKFAIDYLYRVGLREVGDVPNLLYSKKAQGPVTAKFMYITREVLNENLHKNSN